MGSELSETIFTPANCFQVLLSVFSSSHGLFTPLSQTITARTEIPRWRTKKPSAYIRGLTLFDLKPKVFLDRYYLPPLFPRSSNKVTAKLNNKPFRFLRQKVLVEQNSPWYFCLWSHTQDIQSASRVPDDLRNGLEDSIYVLLFELLNLLQSSY